MSEPIEKPWFVEWFDRDYLKVYGHRDARDARLGVDLFERTTRALRGARVLDLGCGPGRHATELVERGARVVGLDLSAVLLAEAHRLAPHLELVRADMRALPFAAASFDAVASFFTSFGYFEDDGNRQALREARRVLAPGGALLIDFVNREQALAHICPESSRRLGSTYVIEARRYDAASGRLIKEIEIQDGSETRKRQESVLLYSPADLTRRLEDAGFVVAATFGDLAGSAFDSVASPRLVLVARTG